MMQPYEVIKQLQATNSRLDKEQILEEAWNAGCTDFFTGAKLACDGLVSFGVKKIPGIQNTELTKPSTTFNSFLQLAIKLQKRELSGHAARDAIEEFVVQSAK